MAKPEKSSSRMGCLKVTMIVFFVLTVLSLFRGADRQPDKGPEQVEQEEKDDAKDDQETPVAEINRDNEESADANHPTVEKTLSVETQEEARTEEPKYIPELTAAEVCDKFAEEGFKLNTEFNPAFMDSGITFPAESIWRCTRKTSEHEMTVEVFGESPTRITLVRGTYMNNSRNDTDQAASNFMGEVVSIPYKESQLKAAMDWVKVNLGRKATTTIGGASLELYAEVPRVRVLLIQPAAVGAESSEAPVSQEQLVEKNERAAASRLRLAQQFIEKGEKTTARRWLSDLIEEYPETKAAKEAKEKLDALK